jgi:signal transduction histidine kinase
MKRLAWACSRAAVLALALACSLAGAADNDAVLRLDRAEFVLDAATAPPPDGAAWQPAALPQAWARERRGPGAGWYRFRFSLDQAPTALQSIYWPAVCCVLAVHVNGTRVGEVGTPERPLMLSTPQRFDIPASLFVAGENRIDLRLEHGRMTWTVLSALEVGPQAVLQPRERLRWWLAIGGSQLLSPLALTISAFVLLLWFKRRSEQMLGFFGLSSLAFAFYASDWLLLRPPIAAADWMLLQGPAAMAINVTATLTAMRYAGLRWRRAEWLLWALIPLAFYQLYSGFSWWGARAFGLFWQWAPLMYIGMFAFAAWRRRSLESLLLFASSPGCLAASLWLGSGYAAADSLDPHCYAFVPMHLLIVWMLVQRHAGALGAAEQLNADLEQRVAAKAAELQHHHDRVLELEQQRAVAAERQRIMSDMHDGIGGQLISTLSLVEHGEASAAEVTDALRECIDDLRLVIDSIEPSDDDLLPALGNLRYRLEPRLRRQGITLDWQVQPLPRLPGLTPQQLLNVLRILQEAFTNVLKHARATRICVATGVGSGAVSITVADDGCGFEPRATGRGHGLANMAERARRVGAELVVQPSDRGTTLSLSLPLPAPA